MNTDRPYRILLIDQDSADAEMVKAALGRRAEPRYSLESVGHLSEGIERLREGKIDAVLLDLFLPYGQGLETFERLWQVAPYLPILIVCRPGDEWLAMRA